MADIVVFKIRTLISLSKKNRGWRNTSKVYKVLNVRNYPWISLALQGYFRVVNCQTLNIAKHTSHTFSNSMEFRSRISTVSNKQVPNGWSIHSWLYSECRKFHQRPPVDLWESERKKPVVTARKNNFQCPTNLGQVVEKLFSHFSKFFKSFVFRSFLTFTQERNLDLSCKKIKKIKKIITNTFNRKYQ